jgi:hypothetical protein
MFCVHKKPVLKVTGKSVLRLHRLFRCHRVKYQPALKHVEQAADPHLVLHSHWRRLHDAHAGLFYIKLMSSVRSSRCLLPKCTSGGVPGAECIQSGGSPGQQHSAEDTALVEL